MAQAIQQPYSEQSEQAALGACLFMDDDAIYNVAVVLEPRHFYLEKHRFIFDAILSVRARGDLVDLLTLSTELDKQGKLVEVGGEAYIAELAACVPTPLNATSYANEVRAFHVRRQVIDGASMAARIAFDLKHDAASVPHDALGVLYAKIQDAATKGEVSLDDALDGFVEGLRDMATSGVLPGLSSGLSTLDTFTGGFRRNNLYIVAAKEKVGKSTLLKTWAYNAALKGKRVGIWTCEMTEAEYAAMLVAQKGQIDVSAGSILNKSSADRQKIVGLAEAASQAVRQMPFKVRHVPGLTPRQLFFEAKVEKMTTGLDMIVVDYLQIMQANAGEDDSEGNREREVNRIALEMKRIAGQLSVPVVSASQLNDNGEVRESRSIKMHCDGLGYLDQDVSSKRMVSASSGGYHELVDMTLNWALQRGGRAGKVSLVCNRSTQTIMERAGPSGNPLNTP